MGHRIWLRAIGDDQNFSVVEASAMLFDCPNRTSISTSSGTLDSASLKMPVSVQKVDDMWGKGAKAFTSDSDHRPRTWNPPNASPDAQPAPTSVPATSASSVQPASAAAAAPPISSVKKHRVETYGLPVPFVIGFRQQIRFYRPDVPVEELDRAVQAAAAALPEWVRNPEPLPAL
jgi:hypothetical protein